MTPRTLLVLRHAKSSWSNDSLDDHERPLSPRGRRDAPAMGAWLAEHAPRPDLVLCSDAVRAAQTWSLVAGALARPTPEATYTNTLYLAGPGRLLDIMSSVGTEVGTLLLVGHNPGLHQLTVGLADDRGEADALARLRAKLPTGALVHLAWDSADGGWASAEAAPWRLVDFQRPKDLPQAESLDL